MLTYCVCKAQNLCKRTPIIISKNTPKSFFQYMYLTVILYEKIGIFLELAENLRKKCLSPCVFRSTLWLFAMYSD